MAEGGFPPGFLWGAATAAYQIEGAVDEGGRGESIWDRFSHTPGKTRDGDTGDVACDHYHRYRDDVRIMRELGLAAYRFSVAWPRIFPEGRGRPNPDGVAFYERLLDELEKAGIQPVVTLYHWDLPQALQDRGGWPHRDTAYRFADYAAWMFDRLGDRVPYWITHNEPFVVSILGHVTGEHAPGLNDPAAGFRTAHHLLLSHGLAVQAFREGGRRKGRIGITLNLSPVHPASGSPEDEAAARRVDGLINRWFLDPLFRGAYPEDMVEHFGRLIPLPEASEADMRLISQDVDFLGVNYYSRQVVRHDPGELFLQMRQIDGPGPKTEMGWEVYPAGLGEILRRLHEAYTKAPLFVTENGAAYPDTVSPDGAVHDPDRIAYLRDHLLELSRVIAGGVPVQGYFLWSLMDNFEWAHGYSKRFGILYVDYPTQRRIWKDSAYWYRRVIEANAVVE
ncbi:MAG: beta-glucosidase [Limnochordaceae bacterium]|nr:beta-glucosidase [Limnochordaceae bacterium]